MYLRLNQWFPYLQSIFLCTGISLPDFLREIEDEQHAIQMQAHLIRNVRRHQKRAEPVSRSILPVSPRTGDELNVNEIPDAECIGHNV